MANFTNKGIFHTFDVLLRGTASPTNYYLALVTSAVIPTFDTNTLSELTEIAAGNGYTSGGFSLARGATDFDVITEDDVNDRAYVQIKDVVWTAAGGPIPSSGSGARYAVFTDDNVTVGSRLVYVWWDLTTDRSVADTYPLTLGNCEFRGQHV